MTTNASSGCAKCGHTAGDHNHKGCRARRADGRPCGCEGGFTRVDPMLPVTVRVSMLREAVDLVASVAQDLNDRSQECKCCGLTKRENWHEANAKVTLQAICVKLERAAGRLVAPQTAVEEHESDVE